MQRRCVGEKVPGCHRTHVGAAAEQQLDDRRVAVIRREVQRLAVAIFIAGWVERCRRAHVGAGVQQQLNGLEAALLRRGMQRGAAPFC